MSGASQNSSSDRRGAGSVESSGSGLSPCGGVALGIDPCGRGIRGSSGVEDACTVYSWDDPTVGADRHRVRSRNTLPSGPQGRSRLLPGGEVSLP